MTSQLNYLAAQQKMADLARASEHAHVVREIHDGHGRAWFARVARQVRLRLAPPAAGAAGRPFRDAATDPAVEASAPRRENHI